LLFNPLIPIYLEKETWIPIDIIVAVFFLIYWRLFNRPDIFERSKVET
jgi:hypothetical protein